jgi:hypothetical protein
MDRQGLSFLQSSGSVMNRFSQKAGTCYGKNYKNASYGFFSQFQDSFFYTNCIQFIIVFIMYINIGKGKYWKILFYASLAGLLGGVLENATVAYICQDNQKYKIYKVIPFLIDEVFWIPCEYAIPFLNLTKMKAFAKGKMANAIYYTIIGLFIPFSFIRLLIGYERMNIGCLQSDNIKKYHGYAFFIMAIADLICTVSILYYVYKHNTTQSFNTSNISNYIKHSSYTILVAVDIVGFSLSILNIITNSGIVEDYIPSTIVTPFHCLKSSFVLILASDALLFKYGANSSSFNSTNESNSKFPSNSNYHNCGYNNGTSAFKTNGNISIDINNNLKPLNCNASFTSLSPNSNMTFNYSPTAYNNSTTITKSRSIIKNYTTNIKTSPSTLYLPSPDSEKTLSPQFGFLNEQQKE